MNVQMHFFSGVPAGDGPIEVLPLGAPTPAGFDGPTDDIVLWNDHGPSVQKRVDSYGVKGVFGFRDTLSLMTEIGERVNAQTGFDPTNAATYTTTNWDNLSAAEKAVAAWWVLVPRYGVGGVDIGAEIFPGEAGALQQQALLGDLQERLFQSRRRRLFNALAAARLRLSPADFAEVQAVMGELPEGTHVEVGLTNNLLDPVFLGAPLLAYSALNTEGTLESAGRPGLYDYLLSRAGTPWDGSGLSAQAYAVTDLTPATCSDLATLMHNILSLGLY